MAQEAELERNKIYRLKNLENYDPEMAKDRLQILCANCNTIKRFEKREINHKYG